MKKTHEEYVEELKIKNPNVEVLEEYIAALTKIKHRCLIHDVVWETTPSRVLNGHGCPKCNSDKISARFTMPYEEYEKKLGEINKNIICIGDYKNGSTKVRHKCLIDGYEWDVTPSRILHGAGCPKCGGTAKKTHSEFVEEVGRINNNVKILGRYKNSNSRIPVQCKTCGNIWEPVASSLLVGNGCKACANRTIGDKIRKTQEQYCADVKSRNENIKVIGTYIDIRTPILHECLICGNQWSTTPGSIMNGNGCPACGRKKISEARSKTHEQYLKGVQEVNDEIIVLGHYSGAKAKILHKCKVCGNEWMAYPNNILKGHGCPYCKKSFGEKYICKYLDDKGVQYEKQKRFDNCRDKRPLPFDFYLPEYNACIEYDGLQHYKPVEFFGGVEGYNYCSGHDKIKNEFCENNNIRLLRIIYGQDINAKLNNFLSI